MVQIFQDLQTYDMSFENVSSLDSSENVCVLRKETQKKIDKIEK